MKCYVTFSFREGVTRKAYEDWFRSVNVPAIEGMSSVTAYQVWGVTGALEGEPPFDVLEEMTITDRGEFEAELESNAAVVNMLSEWYERVAEPVVVYADEVAQV